MSRRHERCTFGDGSSTVLDLTRLELTAILMRLKPGVTTAVGAVKGAHELWNALDAVEDSP